MTRVAGPGRPVKCTNDTTLEGDAVSDATSRSYVVLEVDDTAGEVYRRLTPKDNDQQFYVGTTGLDVIGQAAQEHESTHRLTRRNFVAVAVRNWQPEPVTSSTRQVLNIGGKEEVVVNG